MYYYTDKITSALEKSPWRALTLPTVEVFTRSRNENSGHFLSSLSVRESLKRRVRTVSEFFQCSSTVSEGKGLAFSISHQEEAKNTGRVRGVFVKPHRHEPYPSWTCPLLAPKFNTLFNCACSVTHCAAAVRFLERRGLKVSVLVEITENLQQIEQSSEFRFLPRNGLKTWRMAPKRPKFGENAKKIA